MKKYNYAVYVDDNFHYMDEDERYKLGEFSDCASAVAVCKEVVDRCLREGSSETSTVAELLKGYLLFGDDPFIVTNDPDCKFSARDYARLRCEQMCRRSS